jgi:uncharacterized protein with HEPN domain
MRPEALKYLYDMEQACKLLASFVVDKTFEEYTANALLRSGVERQLTIMGEALNRLMKIEPDLASAVTDARQIIAFRNILVHGYDIVRDDVVWGIIESDLLALTQEVDALLDRGRAEQMGGDGADRLGVSHDR